jgi:hypothetical protein
MVYKLLNQRKAKTMSKRKYNCYIVAGEFTEETFEVWKEALAKYARCESATLYGTTEQSVEVIMSK